MILMSLLSEPFLLLAWLFAVIVTLTVHEFSHALTATMLGDSTAKDAGRLTLNPLPHISWIGFLMLLLAGFGWGNPVPYNPYNLRLPRFGPAIVAAAGPFSNLILAVISGIALKIIVAYQLVGPENLLVQFINLLIVLNVVLMVFNLLPLPPLDGSKILFAILADRRYLQIREVLEERGPMILLLLIIADNFLNINILSGIFNYFVNLVYKVLL